MLGYHFPRRGPHRPRFQGGVVISFPSARQCVGVVDLRGEDGVLLDRSAPPRTDDRGELVEWIQISSCPSPSRSRTSASSTSPCRSSRSPERDSPDCLSQMGQVEAAEHAVPVSVIALGSPDCAASGRGQVSPAAQEEGKRLHLLVHPVGLGVLHQEVAPVDPGSGRRRAGHPALARSRSSRSSAALHREGVTSLHLPV